MDENSLTETVDTVTDDTETVTETADTVTDAALTGFEYIVRISTPEEIMTLYFVAFGAVLFVAAFIYLILRLIGRDPQW